MHKAVQPKFAGVYKVASGEFIPGAAERSGPSVIFNNMVASNYYSVPGANQEWIDDGVLNDRNQSVGHTAREDQVNGFDFIYCSTDPAPTGTITITFYDENVECAGPVNLTPLCAYAITGLPLGTATGGIQCWIVGVDLEGGFECPNNTSQTFRTTEAHAANPLFGWGILPGPNNTGPWLRRGGKGIVNDFTWFDRSVSPPIFVGCFWFGGTPFANFAIRLYGNEPNAKAVVDNDLNAGNGRWGNNPLDILRLKADDPGGQGRGIRKQNPGRWTVTPTTGGQSYSLLVTVINPAIGILPINRPGIGGAWTLLLDPPCIWIPPSPIPMPGGIVTAMVPNVPIGAVIYVQAVCHQGPLNSTGSNVTGASPAICHRF
ncbi:MAG: hypothetical protein EYC70_02210 [Planctomycetota bacterium]|nr:MAG: hypothetical protein EYC70_02210 [Planctomycetota bacterium]